MYSDAQSISHPLLSPNHDFYYGGIGKIKMKRHLTQTALIVAVILLGISVLSCETKVTESFETILRSSFENDLEEWTPQGIDLDLGTGTIEWSITRSQDRATDGTRSAKFFLNNLNDAGKIWLERTVSLVPGKIYNVKISYDFATRDFGSINLFRIIAGVHAIPPRTRQELQSSYRGDTGNGGFSDVGFVWLPKQYEFTYDSGSSGSAMIVIGIWGTWETPRTYYVDNVRVSFTAK